MKQIDKQLEADCHQLMQIDGIEVLLHKNSEVPWFILVPLSQNQIYRELFELPSDQRSNLQRVSDLLSDYLLQSLRSEKINIAAIGNMVEQLHLHVVGRRKDDSCWPKPIWGNLEQLKNYDEDRLEKIKTDISRLLTSV